MVSSNRRKKIVLHWNQRIIRKLYRLVFIFGKESAFRKMGLRLLCWILFSCFVHSNLSFEIKLKIMKPFSVSRFHGPLLQSNYNFIERKKNPEISVMKVVKMYMTFVVANLVYAVDVDGLTGWWNFDISAIKFPEIDTIT